MSSPPRLRIYPCPADPCTSYSTSLASAITHLSTAHPVFHAALEHDFGPPSLPLFIPPLDLLPTHLPSPSTIVLCLRCHTIHPTAAAATTHVATSPSHAASAVLDRARYGPAAARCHMPLMQPAGAASSPAGPTQHNFIYGSNPGMVCSPVLRAVSSLTPQQLVNAGADNDNVLFRALVGGGGAVVEFPRTTAWAAVPALLRAREPRVEWDVLVRGGMQLAYGSVKMGGGPAVMVVTGETGWRRVMRDVKRGERVEWVVR